MKLFSQKLLLIFLLLVPFFGLAQTPSILPFTGSKYQMDGTKGWHHSDSGLIWPWRNAKLSAAGIQFNLPGRTWFDRYGDHNFHGYDGTYEWQFLTSKDTALISALSVAGNDNQQLHLTGKNLSIDNGNTVALPFTYQVDFIDTALAHWLEIQGKQPAGTYLVPDDTDNKWVPIADSVDLTGYATNFKVDTAKKNIRAQIAGITESDPVALAKTVTIGNGYGITGGGGAQAISGNPSRTLAVDTATIFPAVRSTMPTVTESDPIANAHTITIGGGYGLTGGGIAQALSANPSRTLVLDTGTVFPALRATIPAESDPVANAHTVTTGTGYGLTGGGAAQALSSNPARTIVLDTGTVYPGLWSTIAPGTGIGISGRIITNTAPDQTVVFTNGTGISITGAYPNFTVTNTSPSSGGTVTSVTVNSVSPLFTTSTSNNTTTPSTTFTLIQQTQNKIYASPNGSTGDPSFRAMVAADVPTLNQNTTGSAAKWTTPRSLGGNSVDGSADVPFTNKFLVQGISDAGLSNAQFMGALATGIVKNTTTTGVQSIATAGTDYQLPVTWTGVKTSNYSAAAYDAVPVDCSTVSVTVTLPTAPANNTRVWVKCVAIASTFSVTVNCGGSDVLNVAGGSTSGTLMYLNEGAIFHYKASTGIWYVLHSIPRSAFGTNAYTSTSYVAATTTSVNTVPLTSAANNIITVPVSTGVTGLGTGIATALATPSSANIASACSDETGTGALVFANKPTFVGTIHTIVTVSAQAFDGSLGGIYNRTLAASETFTQSNFSTGQPFIVKVKQGSGTSYTVTWWSGITWITTGSTAPTQTTTSNGYTSYGFICTGTNTFDGYLLGSQ